MAVIIWKDYANWVPAVSGYIAPYLRNDAIEILENFGEQDICYDDDDEWLKILDTVSQANNRDLLGILDLNLSKLSVRTYHGCRTPSAESYHARGILCNNPEKLEQLASELISQEGFPRHLRSSISEKLKDFEDRDRDTGRLYLTLDERALIRSCGNYLLYGSEWLTVLFGEYGRSYLLERNIPTIVEVDLPISLVHTNVRRQLAEKMLPEWVRFHVNSPKNPPELDFTFCLHEDIPPELIVGHSHPAFIYDPYISQERENTYRQCPACSDASAEPLIEQSCSKSATFKGHSVISPDVFCNWQETQK